LITDSSWQMIPVCEYFFTILGRIDSRSWSKCLEVGEERFAGTMR